jgi:D-proline reductase (dithiol) PrdD
VELSSHTSISGRTLFLDSGDLAEFAGRYPELEAVRLSLIRPGETDLYINSILDFSPIAVKVSGQAGTGVTNILSGVRVMLTGVETGGFQPANIGSSEGFFKDKVKLNRCGTPGENETILHFDMLLAEGQGRTRQGIMAAHRAADEVVQKIREELKGVNGALAGENREFFDVSRTGGYRVLLIKLVSGLGCLYDTALFPTEPGGFLGSRSIMELSNNMQVALTPNEYRDGMVHSLC